MPSVTLRYVVKTTATEVLSVGVPAQSGGSAIIHDGFDTTMVLDADTAPPVTKAVAFEDTLGGAATTIDLTALTGANGATVDGTGLRVQSLKVRNKVASGANMQLSAVGGNPYDGFGANFLCELIPGAEITLYTNDNGSDIAAGNKNLFIAGTATDVSEIVIVMG